MTNHKQQEELLTEQKQELFVEENASDLENQALETSDKEEQPAPCKKFWEVSFFLGSALLLLLFLLLVKPILLESLNDSSSAVYQVEIEYQARVGVWSHFTLSNQTVHKEISIIAKIGEPAQDNDENFIVQILSVDGDAARVRVIYDADTFKECCQSEWEVTSHVNSRKQDEMQPIQTCKGCSYLGSPVQVDHQLRVKVSEAP